MSGDHKYTVAEIDRMRALIYGKVRFEKHWFTSSASEDERMWRNLSDNAARYAASVEDKLRTYMIGGVRPEELERALGQGEKS